VQGRRRFARVQATPTATASRSSAEETDWPQILACYDDLVMLTEDPVHQDPAAVLGRAVAVGHVLGAAAGLRETDRLREVIGERCRA
jgi:predicted RNA polymerase sigma factor